MCVHVDPERGVPTTSKDCRMLSFTLRLPPRLRTEDEQSGEELTWRTNVSVCFAAKLCNLFSAFVLYQPRRLFKKLCLCYKFNWWKHNKWMLLDPGTSAFFSRKGLKWDVRQVKRSHLLWSTNQIKSDTVHVVGCLKCPLLLILLCRRILNTSVCYWVTLSIINKELFPANSLFTPSLSDGC